MIRVTVAAGGVVAGDQVGAFVAKDLRECRGRLRYGHLRERRRPAWTGGSAAVEPGVGVAEVVHPGAPE